MSDGHALLSQSQLRKLRKQNISGQLFESMTNVYSELIENMKTDISVISYKEKLTKFVSKNFEVECGCLQCRFQIDIFSLSLLPLVHRRH